MKSTRKYGYLSTMSTLTTLVLAMSVAHAEIKYPIVSSKLSPAVSKIALVESNIPDEVAPPVIILVGDDPISLKWLKDSQEFLSATDSDFYVITNVIDAQHLARVKTQLPKGATVLPMNANWIAERYHIKHYPYILGLDDEDKSDIKTINTLKATKKQLGK